jgi:hypothetical protein
MNLTTPKAAALTISVRSFMSRGLRDLEGCPLRSAPPSSPLVEGDVGNVFRAARNVSFCEDPMQARRTELLPSRFRVHQHLGEI